MSIAEAEDYIDGLMKRPRDMMEATRAICQTVHKILTGQNLNWNFDWDNEDNKWDDEDVDEAMAEARRMEEWMKERMKNGKG